MSVSNISSGYSYYQSNNSHQQRKQEIDALTQALQSGDLSAAQQAFGQLQQGAPSGSSGQTSSNSGDAVITDISALGKALSENDLSSAQTAFSALQDDFKNGAPPPPPPSSSDSTSSSSDSDSVKSLFEKLAEALQSGDLSSAQDAFSSLQATAPSQTSETDSNNPFANDIQSLSDALSSGDISSAQTAFAQLQDDIKNSPPPPPPPGGFGGPGGPSGGGDKVQQAFSDLATALQSGDLDAAKTAFATLQSLSPDNQSTTSSVASTTSTDSSTSSTNNSSTGTDQIGTDLSSLSDALQKGDLDSAQSLFQSLLEDLQANAPRHPGINHYQQNDSTSASNISVTA